MSSEKLHGFILKRTNFGESDKIVTVLTRVRGKIKVLAKGIRKIKSRRAPHLELFNEVEIMVHDGKTFSLINEARTINSNFQTDLKKTGYIFYISEILDKLLAEDQPHPEVFDSLLKTIKNLDENNTKKFAIQVLWDLGFLPRGEYPKQGVTDFIEGITERPIKSRKFIESL